MVIFKDVIYLFDIGAATFIFSIDRNKGTLNWESNGFPIKGGWMVNSNYGKIYQFIKHSIS